MKKKSMKDKIKYYCIDIYSYDDGKIAGHLAKWKKEGIKGNVLGKAILRPKGYNLNKMARN